MIVFEILGISFMRMNIFSYKLITLILVAGFLASAPFQHGLCDCSKLDEPCSADGKVGKCCATYTNDKGETKKLKCSDKENMCVDDGSAEK